MLNFTHVLNYNRHIFHKKMNVSSYTTTMYLKFTKICIMMYHILDFQEAWQNINFLKCILAILTKYTFLFLFSTHLEKWQRPSIWFVGKIMWPNQTFNRCHHFAQIFSHLEIIGKKGYGPRFGLRPRYGSAYYNLNCRFKERGRDMWG